MPDIGLDRFSRQLIVEGKGLLSSLELVLRENPEVAQFLDFEGGLNAYIGRLEPSKHAWIFSFNFYQLLFDCVFIQLGLAGMTRQVIDLSDGTRLLKDECIPAIREVRVAVENESKASREENSERLKAVEGAVNSFKARLEIFLPLQTGVITESIAALGLAIDGALAVQTTAVGEAIGASTASVVEAINELPDKIHEKFQEGIPATAETISDQVALKVVGESYYKWNSVSSFYPTVVFIFREVTDSGRPKRTQIKTRYNARSEDFTEDMLNQLRQSAEALAGLTYNHGIVRGNYVSSDKRFKTTVFGEDQAGIVALFDRILPVINEPFQRGNLSFTTGPRRVSVTRRSVPLADVPAQYDEYNMVFIAEIYRVVLLINGLEKPIVLWFTR